jgi:hypothetical protein
MVRVFKTAALFMWKVVFASLLLLCAASLTTARRVQGKLACVKSMLPSMSL